MGDQQTTGRWAVEVKDNDGPDHTYRLLAVQIFDTKEQAIAYARNNRDSDGRLPSVRPAFPDERSFA
jgi:hypothetical protein